MNIEALGCVSYFFKLLFTFFVLPENFFHSSSVLFLQLSLFFVSSFLPLIQVFTFATISSPSTTIIPV